MHFLGISKLFNIVFTTATITVPQQKTVILPRYGTTSWDTPAESAGIRIFGPTWYHNGIAEVSLDGEFIPGSTPRPPWKALIRLSGNVTTADGSDFAAISSPGGAQVIVFFMSDSGALVYGNWTSGSDPWTLGTVGGAAPLTRTSIGAGMWGPNHLSVFHQGPSGVVYESEFANGTWASPRVFALANNGTDINVVSTTRTSGLVKAVYLQDGTQIQEWSWSQSTGANWTKTTLTAFPAQSTNVRFTMPYLTGDNPPGRIYYVAGGGTIGRIAGSVGNWGRVGDLDVVKNVAAGSDITSSLQFASPGGPVAFIVYSSEDGWTWQVFFQPYVGWQAPIPLG